VSEQQLRGVALDEFYEQYSAYIDGFLERRSVLSASLFPEKPAQMYFGYAWTERAAPAITEWLSHRHTASELGELFRGLRSQANALSVTSSIWMYLMGTLGRELSGAPWSASVAREVLAFWGGVYEAYTAWSDPPSRVPERGQNYERLLVLDRPSAEALTETITPNAGDTVRAALAVCANYSWLLECESRQGTFSHGLYSGDDGLQFLVREFGNLGGSLYPWMDGSAQLPAEPIAIVLALRDVEARFDAFGVSAVEPASYEKHIAGVAVIAADGVEKDPDASLARLMEEVTKAHRALFRTIATWSKRDRFIAGARSYGRIWADILARAGASGAEIDRLVFASLDEFTEERLEEHLSREEPAPIWPWVSATDRPTVFSPVLAALQQRG
jgi:hypothetical protein